MLQLVILNFIFPIEVAEAAESISAMVTIFKSVPDISKQVFSLLFILLSGMKVENRPSL